MSDLKLTPQVLAMYLGCEIEAKGSRGILRNVNLKGFCTLQLSEEIGQGIGCLVEEVKPILRRLSSMTEEDSIEMFGTSKENFYAKENAKPEDLFLFTPNETAKLLSKHFDLFGLLDAGLAIEKP